VLINLKDIFQFAPGEWTFVGYTKRQVSMYTPPLIFAHFVQDAKYQTWDVTEISSVDFMRKAS
jgi:hypothetical protein